MGAAIFSPLERHSGGYQGIDSRGFQALLTYTPNQHQRITLTQLLSDETEIESLETQAVLIGMSAPTSNPTEYFLTPMGTGQWPQTTLPGIDIHAQSLHYLLAVALDEMPVRRTLPGWGDVVWIAVWTLVGSGLAFRQRWWAMWLLSLGGTVSVLYGASWGLFALGLWVPLVPAALGLVGSSVGAIAPSLIHQLKPHGAKP
ncbi:MAG: CHASE2 domain-containing protein [Cyanobacteria bacterium P01_F01_bin.116]